MQSPSSHLPTVQSESTELVSTICSSVHVDDNPVAMSDDSHMHSPLSCMHSSKKSGVTSYSEQVQDETNLPMQLN